LSFKIRSAKTKKKSHPVYLSFLWEIYEKIV